MKILKNLLSNLWSSKKSWRNSFQYLLVIGFFVFLATHLGVVQKQNSAYSRSGDSTRQKPASAFENIKLEAKAAYVFDAAKNKPIYELNSDSQLPLASLAKIMTAIIAKENMPSGLLVTLTKEAILQEGDDGFIVDEKWPASELNSAMLITSSNDAAFAFSSEYKKDFDKDFIFLMNEKARKLGLAQTYFLNPTGLDESKNVSGAYGSAKDVAKLLLYAVKNHSSLLESTRLSSIILNFREFKNTDQIINDLPGFIAGKTGSSDLAGGNLAVAVDLGYEHPIIFVVLGSSDKGRFEDVKTLYRAAISDIINF